jgi:hypothetical protein
MILRIGKMKGLLYPKGNYHKPERPSIYLVIYGKSCAALDKGSDADLSREIVGYVAQRLMETHQGSLAVACHDARLSCHRDLLAFGAHVGGTTRARMM